MRARVTRSGERECLFCGMLQACPPLHISDRSRQPACIKCDTPLFAPSDGSTLTLDIAHHHETVSQALDKFARALERAWSSHAWQLRLIVGSGAIREAVLGELYFMQSREVVLELREENRGALLIRIRQ